MDRKQEILIIGLGSQGKTWALNLRDSGHKIVLGLRGESTQGAAQSLGFPWIELGPELAKYKNICLLIPDDQHASFLRQWSSFIPRGSRILYAHGLSCMAHELHKAYPQLSHLLLAPKAIASEIRQQYQKAQGVGGVYSLEYSLAPELDQQFLQQIATDLGINKLFKVSFEQETKADLFSEQSILCSALPYLSLKSYQILRQQNIPPELAYMECWLELKLIASVLVDKGPMEFFKMISPAALVGSESAQKFLFDNAFDQKLEKLFKDIDNGSFFQELDKVDFKAIREKVLNRWQNQELTETFKRLKE